MRRQVCNLLLLLVAFPVTRAYAQVDGLFYVDTSVRSLGMASASTSVWWGRTTNSWANPALLGYEEGFRLDVMESTSTGSETVFRSNRLSAGISGFGFLYAGPWPKILGSKTEYEEVDGFSPFVGTYSVGFGGNLVRMVDALRESKRGVKSNYHAHFEASLGWAYNRIDTLVLDPEYIMPKELPRSHDVGGHVRFTPYNSIETRGLFPGLDRKLRPFIGGWRLDLAAGTSRQNMTDDPTESETPRPSFKRQLVGWSVHMAIDFPGDERERLYDHGVGWLAEFLSPLVSWGKSWDQWVDSSFSSEQASWLDQPTVKRSGWELSIGNIFSIRRGKVDGGNVSRTTSGWSAGLPFGPYGGIRYERASHSYGRQAPTFRSDGWYFFIDVRRINKAKK